MQEGLKVSEIENKVFEIAKEHSNIKNVILSKETRIAEDLSLLGDDAEEFLEAVMQQYKMDVSGFNFSNYFPYEGTSNLHYYSSQLSWERTNSIALKVLHKIEASFWHCFSDVKDYRTLTLGDLISSIPHGKLV